MLPEDDLLRSKHVGVPLNIFMYFNQSLTIPNYIGIFTTTNNQIRQPGIRH